MNKCKVDQSSELRLIGIAAQALVKAGYKIQVRDGELCWVGEQTQSVADIQSASIDDNETGEARLYVYQPHEGDLDHHVGCLQFFFGCGNNAFSHVNAERSHFDRIGAALHNVGMCVDACGNAIPAPNVA